MMRRKYKRGAYNEHRKKSHTATVTTAKVLYILRTLTIRELDLRSLDPSQLRLAIRTRDHPKNPKENFKLKRNLRWPTTQGRSTYPPHQWPWGVLIPDWPFRSEPPPVGLQFTLGPYHIWQIEGKIDIFIMKSYFRLSQ